MKIGLLDHAKDDRPLVAIVLLLIAVFTLGFQDALMKLMSSETSFWQIQTLRSIGNLCFTMLLAVFGGSLLLIKPRNWKGVYLRALFLAICMFFFSLALLFCQSRKWQPDSIPIRFSSV